MPAYRFQYTNQQGRNIEILFWPNKSGSPPIIDLIENVFEVGVFSVTTEQDYIKDIIASTGTPTIEIKVSTAKLNDLAMKDENYAHIYNCLIDYRTKMLPWGNTIQYRYNVFEISIDGQHLQYQYFCQREFIGSLVGDATITATELLSSQLLNMEFNLYYRRIIDSIYNSGRIREVPALWQWFCNNHGERGGFLNPYPHAFGLFPAFSPYANKGNGPTAQWKEHKSTMMFSVKLDKDPGSIVNYVLLNNYGSIQMVRLVDFIERIYAMAVSLITLNYVGIPDMANLRTSIEIFSSGFKGRQFYKQRYDGSGLAGEKLSLQDLWISTGGVAPRQIDGNKIVDEILFGYYSKGDLNFEATPDTWEKLDFDNMKDYLETFWISMGIYCTIMWQPNSHFYYLQVLNNKYGDGLSSVIKEIDLSNAITKEIQVADLYTNIEYNRSDTADSINLLRVAGNESANSETQGRVAGIDETVHNSINCSLEVQRIAVCSESIWREKTVAFMGLNPKRDYRSGIGTDSNNISGHNKGVHEASRECFDVYTYDPNEWNHQQLFYIEGDGNIVNIPSAFAVHNLVEFTDGVRKREYIPTRSITGYVDWTSANDSIDDIIKSVDNHKGQEELWMSIGRSRQAKRWGYGFGINARIASQQKQHSAVISMNNALYNAIISATKKIQQHCSTQGFQNILSNNSKNRYLLDLTTPDGFGWEKDWNHGNIWLQKHRITNLSGYTALNILALDWHLLGYSYDFSKNTVSLRLIGEE